MKSLLTSPLIRRFIPENRAQIWIWGGIVVFTGLLALVLDFGGSEETPQKIEAEDPESAATHIPEGFVLVPIEVANFESLDSILGKFGVVDLYSAPLDPTLRPKKVATKIKILRAPLNPNHFAVLARDTDSEKILSFSGPFTVVVQNPNRGGTGFVNTDAKEARGPRTLAKRNSLSRITIEVDHANETAD